jgi:hypothetical protein
VTKIPKWDLAKFSSQVDRAVGSSMKSVGEVMAIGRTFEESLQKAIRQVDPRWDGFEAYVSVPRGKESELDSALTKPTDMRLFVIAEAMYNHGYSVDKVHDLTKIDKVRVERVHPWQYPFTSRRLVVVPVQDRQHRADTPYTQGCGLGGQHRA